MLLSSLLLLPLVQGSFALYTDFRVPFLRAVSDNGLNRTSVRFIFEDTNTNSSTTCAAQFPRNGTEGQIVFPEAYIACGSDPNFAWKFGYFDGVDQFQLELRRSFRDPNVGDPPMDIVTLFGYRNITEGPDYRCRTPPRGVKSCRTPGNSTLIVPVTAAIAKK